MNTLTIEALFFTNIWIFVYTRVIFHLRLLFPPRPNDNFLILGVYPEPFEIPLYILFSTITVLLIYFLHPRIKQTLEKFPKLLQYFLLILLALLFMNKLGTFPLKEQLSEKFIFIPLVYILIAVTVTLEILILKLSLFKNRFKNSILYLLVLLFIAVITFPPRFSISGVDYSYFYGPIWEIAHGKTIFSEISSQYGFLSILFLASLNRLGFALGSLPIFIWLLFVIQYFLCFYLISKQSKSMVFGLIGVCSILTVNFFTMRVIPTDYPQAGPLRWLPLIGSLFLFQKLKDITSYKLIIFIALASLWMVDSGIELIFAYGFSLILLYLTKQLDAKKTIRTFALLFVSLLTFFALVQLFHLILGYKTINFFSVFTKLQQYAKAGFGMLPIETKNYFWIGMLFYFASIIYFFRNNKKVNLNQQDTRNKQNPNNKDAKLKLFDKLRFGNWNLFGQLGSWDLGFDKELILFSANLMFFASIYYVGRSHPAELYTISLFILLNAFLLLGIFYQRLQTTSMKLITTTVLFFLFIFLPTINRAQALNEGINTRLKRLSQGNIFKPEMDELLQKKYEKEIEMIKSSFPEKEILIISGDDTYLLYLTKKTSLLSDNSLVNILTKQDLQSSLKKVAQFCPKKIVGECRLFKSCPATELFSKAFYAWQPIILSEVQTACHVKYKPIQCTEKLCVAEISK